MCQSGGYINHPLIEFHDTIETTVHILANYAYFFHRE